MPPRRLAIRFGIELLYHIMWRGVPKPFRFWHLEEGLKDAHLRHAIVKVRTLASTVPCLTIY